MRQSIMRVILSLLGAATAGAPTVLLLNATMANVSSLDRVEITAVLLLLAILIGLLVGSVVARRAADPQSSLSLFTATAGAVGGGLVGAVCIGALTALFLLRYGAWPDGVIDRALYVLAIPAFAGLGWFIGAILGWVAGLVGGSLLGVLRLARR